MWLNLGLKTSIRDERPHFAFEDSLRLFNILQRCGTSTQISFACLILLEKAPWPLPDLIVVGSKHCYALGSPQQWINLLSCPKHLPLGNHVTILILHFWVNLSCTFIVLALFVFLSSLTGRISSLRPFLVSAKRSAVIEIKCSFLCKMLSDCAFYLRSHWPLFFYFS